MVWLINTKIRINTLSMNVFVWEVRPKEIVGHWDWTTIPANPRWYEEKMHPTFKRYNNPPLHQAQTRSAFNMSTLKNALDFFRLV